MKSPINVLQVSGMETTCDMSKLLDEAVDTPHPKFDWLVQVFLDPILAILK